jgi:hypothetical protein
MEGLHRRQRGLRGVGLEGGDRRWEGILGGGEVVGLGDRGRMGLQVDIGGEVGCEGVGTLDRGMYRLANGEEGREYQRALQGVEDVVMVGGLEEEDGADIEGYTHDDTNIRELRYSTPSNDRETGTYMVPRTLT